jgi:uncharacterized membrane protein
MARHTYTKEEIADWRKNHGSFVYFNPDDANFTVPKPYTYGVTFNWAHPLSLLIGAAVIALIVYTVYFK